MRKLILAVSLLAVAAVVTAPRSGAVARHDAAPPGARFAALAELQFVANHGQWHEQVRYAALGDTTSWLHDDGFTLRLARWDAAPAPSARERGRECVGGVVRTRFVGGAARGFTPGEALATRHHFLIGDERAWRLDVPAFAAVTAEQVLPGIDVRYRPLPTDAAPRGAFEYDLLLAPGADLDAFVAECEGVDRLRIDADGRLVADVATPRGTYQLVQQAPIAWQQGPEGQRPLRVAFRLFGSRRYGFVAEGRDPALAAVVDPGVVWGSFVGGGATDRIEDVEWVPGTGVWVAGWTGSTDFPTTVGAFRTTGGNDGFVARLSEDGQQLRFATYLGGAEGDAVRAIAISTGGTPTLVGFTNSTDFPTTIGAAQPNYAGGDAFVNIGDAFVTRLNASGTGLLGSTYLGGIFDDIAEAVVTDQVGNAYVAGWTTSLDFPTTQGAVQPELGGIAIAQSDGFVAKIDALATTVQWGTYLGGQASEQLLAIDRDPVTGNLLLTGWTLSNDYPTSVNAAQPAPGGQIDAVSTSLSGDGASLVFSTFVGGVGEDVALDTCYAADGSAWLCGSTASTNYPTTLDAPQRSAGGVNDGMVTRVNASGTSILFSTRLGGPLQDRARGVSVVGDEVLVVGEAGAGFPTTADAAQPQFGGGVSDAFAVRLTNGGATLAWSSYFGGAAQDAFGSVQLEPSGLAVFAGWTYSADFPVTPAGHTAALGGVEDGVLMQFDTVDVLGAALEVLSPMAPPVEVVDGGDQELLSFELRNTSPRALVVDGLRVFVDGVGVGVGSVGELRVWRDGALVGAAQPVIGAEATVALAGASVPVGATVPFRVTATLSADPAGRTTEVAATILGVDSWQVRALGAGDGPDVFVFPSGRSEGPVYVLGAEVADVDGDGERTVFDVRKLLLTVGSPEIVVDVDGDEATTPVDVQACAAAVIGRGSVFSAPNLVFRDSWLSLRCLLPSFSSVQVSLGGRSLEVGRALPRRLTVRVPAGQATGVQELVVSLGGRVLFQGNVEVQ